MDFTIDLGLGGWTILIVGALIFGFAAQYVGEAETGWEWLADAIGTGVGALVASEFIVAWRTVAPVWDGLAVLPALAGGLLVGIVVELATRYLTGGRYTHGVMPA